MEARNLVKVMILKRLVESIAEDKRASNMPAMERVAEKITDDVGSVLALLIHDDDSRAPKQRPIKGLSS